LTNFVKVDNHGGHHYNCENLFQKGIKIMAEGMKEIEDGNFESEVLKSEMPVLVDFWAPWCGPCKMMAPAFHEAARQLEPRVRLAKLNTEDEQGIAGQFGIRSIPTLALFRDGREVARQAGAMGAADIVRWVRAQQA
jgi:thioredoxin 2